MKKADKITFPDGTIQETAVFYQAPSVPSGAILSFANSTAPTGWTKITTYDNYASRIVSGAGAGTGGSVNFTTAFASQTPTGSVSNTFSINSTTISTTQMPSHTHTVGPDAYNSPPSFGGIASGRSAGAYYIESAATGGGSSHTHGLSGAATFAGNAINLAVKYIDMILCQKN